VRMTAAVALGNIGGASAETAIPSLIEAVRTGRAKLRAAAAKALTNFGCLAAIAVPALAEALGDPDFEVRLAAADALGAIGSPGATAVPALSTAFAGPAAAVISSRSPLSRDL